MTENNNNVKPKISVFKGLRIRRKSWKEKGRDFYLVWNPAISEYKCYDTDFVYPAESIAAHDDWELVRADEVAPTRLVYIRGFADMEGLCQGFSQNEREYDPYDVVIAICIPWGFYRKKHATIILRRKEDKAWFHCSCREDASWGFEYLNPIKCAKRVHPDTLINKISLEGMFNTKTVLTAEETQAELNGMGVDTTAITTDCPPDDTDDIECISPVVLDEEGYIVDTENVEDSL